MNCEKCNSNKATIHLTEIIKDYKSEIHICEICAKEIGLNSKLSGFSLTLSDMFTFMEPEELNISEKNNSLKYIDGDVCNNCGRSFWEYRRIGKLGCQYCYEHLEESMKSIILSYHKEKKHIGKIPFNTNKDSIKIKKNVKLTLNNETISDLNKKLKKAIVEERYEDAAIIRDLIKK